jgi:hypothetical protein
MPGIKLDVKYSKLKVLTTTPVLRIPPSDREGRWLLNITSETLRSVCSDAAMVSLNNSQITVYDDVQLMRKLFPRIPFPSSHEGPVFRLVDTYAVVEHYVRVRCRLNLVSLDVHNSGYQEWSIVRQRINQAIHPFLSKLVSPDPDMAKENSERVYLYVVFEGGISNRRHVNCHRVDEASLCDTNIHAPNEVQQKRTLWNLKA